MVIQTLEVGALAANCYVVADPDSLDCAVIDPGAESAAILNYIDEAKFNISAILLTHGHQDHVAAVGEIVSQRPCPVFIHQSDLKLSGGFPGVRHYDDGDTVAVGNLTFKIMATPGHTPGSVCIICNDAIFAGDTLFRDSCGRTDLDGGSMETELASLKRLYLLPGDYEVYPGHDLATTLSRERSNNYYMKYAADKS